MKTIKINLYSLNELSEQARKKAIKDNWDLNVSHNWWQTIYDDCASYKIEVTSFDLDHRNEITGKFIDEALDTALLVLENHGE